MLNLLTKKFEKQLKQESTKRQSTLVEELNQLNLEEDSDKFGKFRSKRLKDLIYEYNNLKIGDSIHESTTVCRMFDSLARQQGLKYTKDFICPPYMENTIIKLTNRKVNFKD